MLKLRNVTVLISALAIIFATRPSVALACSYPNDQELSNKQRECANDAARTWSCEVNRCVTTAEAQGIRERYKECAEIANDAERKKCHDDYAKRESNVENKEKGASSALSMSAAAINGINAALLFLAGQGKSPGGQCWSRKIYMAASLVSVMAELYLMLMVDKKLKEIQEKYESEQVQDEAYSAQMRALQYLKEEQDTIADMAKSRKNAYTLQMALYGATTIMALAEITFGKTPPAFTPTPCLSKEEQAEKDQLEKDNAALEEQNTKLEAENQELTKNGPPTEADSKTIDANNKQIADNKEGIANNNKKYEDGGYKKETPKDTGGGDSTKEAGKAGAGMLAGFADVLGTSEAIAITSGISFGFATYLRSAAAKQEAEAKENSKKVSEMIKKFSDVMSGSGYCSPKSREDLGSPQCYCYEANGQKNMNRSNSQICQALWAQNSQSLMVAAGNYAGKKAFNPKTCILVNGQTDRDCKCKQMINKTSGENACLKVPLGSNSLGSLGPAMGLPALQTTVGNLTNGNSSIGNLNGDALNKQVARIQKVSGPMIDKLNQKRASQGLGPVDPFDKKFQDGMIKKLSSAGVLSNAAAASSPASLAVAARPSKGKLANGLLDADKKSGISKRSYFGGKGIRSRGGSGKPKDDFAFLNGGGDSGGGKVMGTAEEKYNYKDNDIVKNKSVSIWKVISNRYLQSGVRRLFEDKQ